MKKVFLIIFLCFIALASEAATWQSAGNGNWTTNTSWAGQVNYPQGNTPEAIEILPDHNITLPSGILTYNGVIHIYGTLTLDGKLTMGNNSLIKIYDGGKLYINSQLIMGEGSVIQLQEGSDVIAAGPGNNGGNERLKIGNTEVRDDEINGFITPNQLTEGTLTTGGCAANPGVCEPNPLPVTLLYFKAQAQQQSVEITWASTKAWDFSHYELERSADGTNFDYVATIDAAEFSNETVEYSYSDRQPIFGTSYYRLKAVDVDGAYEYKEIAAVQFGSETFSVFPNPSILGYINISWSQAVEGASVILRDNTGRIVRTVSLNKNTPSISTEGLMAGIYLLSVQSPAGSKHAQVLIQ